MHNVHWLRTYRLSLAVAVLVAGTVLSGCGQPAGTPDQAAPGGMPQLPDAVRLGTDPSEMVRIPAEPGVGEQGRSLQNEQGIGGAIVQPARTLFAVKERLTFDMLKANLDRFEALEGRGPSSHDEFMQRIVQEGAIKLPRLPDGQRFVYDPQRKELMVERPAQ